MKKTKQVRLDRMRKNWRPFAFNSLSLAIVSSLIAGCGDSTEEATIYRQVGDCISDNPEFADQCEAAYQNAVQEAERTAPKYQSEAECVQEFGLDACVRSPNSNWFMPAMTGFMFARMLDGSRPYYSQPMYYSRYPGSIFYDRWVSADGHDYGSSRYRKSTVNVSRDQMKPKATVSRTISRGGFGSTVSAKSSWGSSRSSSSTRSSWGG